jgi:hypothetical protein
VSDSFSLPIVVADWDMIQNTEEQLAKLIDERAALAAAAAKEAVREFYAAKAEENPWPGDPSAFFDPGAGKWYRIQPGQEVK